MKSHAHLGRAWEDALDTQHEVYRAQRLAEVERLSPPFQVLSVQGSYFRGQFRGKGRADYLAAVRDLGAVYVEAKSTHALRWSFDQLDEAQARFLDSRPHAVRGLAIRWETVNAPWRAVWVPWETAAPVWWLWSRGAAPRASWTATEAAALGVEMRGADWLAAVRTWRGR